MIRFLLVLLLVAPVVAAPKGNKELSEPYFSCKVGTTRVYEWVIGKKIEFTHIVEKVEKQKDGNEIVSCIVKTKTGGVFQKQFFAVSSQKISLISVDGKEEKKRFDLLNIPAKVGDEWTSEDHSNHKVTQKVVALDEEVTVPAGKFKCVVIAQTHQISGASRPFYTKVWYARGIGVVKSEQDKSVSNFTIQLKTLSLGK